MKNLEQLPENLPVPTDDGATRHLVGSALPSLTLPSTIGEQRLSELPKLSVLFFYPRTGIPGQPPNLGFGGESWDSIPGARGCTPQCKGFSSLFESFRELGAEVFGLSTQTSEFQREFQQRQSIPFEFLSDAQLLLAHAMKLPTFEFPITSGGPNTLFKRMAWLVHHGRILKVWYPVFPPNECAQRVLDWVTPRAKLLNGTLRNGIRYQLESSVGPTELAQVFAGSGISRPVEDAARLSEMLSFSNLVLGARDLSGNLVGVLRAYTDLSWSTYVSDLAVTRSHQKRGIGKELLALAKEYGGPRCTLSLNAAPSAVDYYPRLGMKRLESAWHWKRTE